MARDRKTLSDVFAPPSTDMQGIHALLCAYSADESFLTLALDRFTGVGPQSRLARGSVDATLMLDPNHAVFEAQVVPGLRQLHPRSADLRPVRFDQMHAKVALLAFGKCRAGNPEHYRIVVSTGNWTEASAKRLIEMVWSLDIPAGSKEILDRRDLHACATFFNALMGCYQNGPPIVGKAMQLLQQCLKMGTPAGPRTPTRFISNLPSRRSENGLSLMRCFTDEAAKDEIARNLLVCGSGFFEQDTRASGAPKVLDILTNDLLGKKAVKPGLEMRVVLNPENGGQVAQYYRRAKPRDLTLYRPKDPVSGANAARAQLHAKFCYIGKLRGARLSGGLLYVGSGNLTFPGFVRRPVLASVDSQDRGSPGNVETGVLVRPDLDMGPGAMNSWQKLQNLLPIGKSLKPEEVKAQQQAAEEEEFQPAGKPAPPIMAFTLGTDNSLAVHWSADWKKGAPVEVDIPERGAVVIPDGAEFVALDSAVAAQWLVVRADGVEWRIPCLGASGDFPRCVARQSTFRAWLDELADFPGSWNDPAGDDPDDGGEESWTISDYGHNRNENTFREINRDFPAHAAALLIESVAQQNGNVPEDRMKDYLAHLQRAMTDGLPPGFLEEWQKIGVNFLTPLLSREGFAPAWKNLRAYEQLLEELMKKWGFDRFPALKADP